MDSKEPYKLPDLFRCANSSIMALWEVLLEGAGKRNRLLACGTLLGGWLQYGRRWLRGNRENFRV